MTFGDIINGCFEFGGSIAIWRNVFAIYKDKKFLGIRISPILFFTLWGYWNLYYYPSLHQTLSLLGGISITLANSIYVYLMVKYRKSD